MSTNICIICEEVTTDPVCVECHIKHALLLLSDLRMKSLIVDFIERKLRNKFNFETQNDSLNECIFCKDDNVFVCDYCFSTRLMKLLKQLEFTNNNIESFERMRYYE